MSKLSAKERNSLPSGDFAGPDRSYPVNDANHARNALARASEMYNKGRLSEAQYAKIKAKAKARLGEK